MQISEFKARNQEAQALNAEIQKAQGALEENKRQFAALCGEYEKQFGEHIDESNLAQVLARVTAEVEAEARKQAEFIEAVKSGGVVRQAQGANATSDAVAVGAIGAVAQAQAAQAQVAEPVQMTIEDAPVSGIAGTPPTVAQTAPPVFNSMQAREVGVAQVDSPAGSVGTAGTGATRISAAALSPEAIQQSNNAFSPTMPNQAPEQAAPIAAGAQSGISGWNANAGAGVDFNALLGASFGGGK